MNRRFRELTKSMRQCQICKADLAHAPNPVFQLHPKARILIAGQAPGRKAHESGMPFDDPSGDRLREWMHVSREMFYDATKFAILPMGLCYPGHGRSGDLPPRRECAPAWREQALGLLPHIQLMLVIGQYALKWHLGESMRSNLTETVKEWESHLPQVLPLPHPSPRNNLWLRKNPWFERRVLPVLRNRVADCLKQA